MVYGRRDVSDRTREVRSLRRSSTIKRADATGGGDRSFEEALSNMVHADLAQNAPGLLDYEVGFQLIDRSDDNDKAFGVTGFKIGDQWVYAPVFFLNGELKGGELLWLKNQNTMVPRREKWIDYILNRKPVSLGKGVPRDFARSGTSQPDMLAMTASPLKYAGTVYDWAVPGIAGLAAVTRTPPKYACVLPEFLKQSAAASATFIHMLDAYPTLLPGIVRAYGPDVVRDAITTAKTAATISPVRPAAASARSGSIWRKTEKPETSLEIFTDTTKFAAELTHEERISLRRKGYLIRDHRKTAATAYHTDKPVKWFNPDKTGLYMVVCSDGKPRKALIVAEPKFHAAAPGYVLVIGLESSESSHSCAYIRKADVFAAERLPEKQFRSWLKKQKKAGKQDLRQHTYHVLLGPNYEGTVPFEPWESLPVGHGRLYRASFAFSAASDKTPVLADLPPLPEEKTYPGAMDYRIWLGATDSGRIRKRGRTLLVPRDYVVIPVSYPDKSELTSKYVLAGLSDIYAGILSKTAEVKVWTDGTETIINGNRLSPVAAVISLVRDYGLREKTAEDILSEAARKRSGVRVRVKLAAPDGMPWLQNPETAPPIQPPAMVTDPYLGSGLPAQVATTNVIGAPTDPAPQPQPNMAAPPLNDPTLLSGIQTAANTGQREVLDVSLLAALLKANREDAMIDRYLSKLVTGMDSVGRILANLYMHPDKFAERFGENDLPQLEDLLKATFENLGDVVLFLKHKNAVTQIDYPDIVDMDSTATNL